MIRFHSIYGPNGLLHGILANFSVHVCMATDGYEKRFQVSTKHRFHWNHSSMDCTLWSTKIEEWQRNLFVSNKQSINSYRKRIQWQSKQLEFARRFAFSAFFIRIFFTNINWNTNAFHVLTYCQYVRPLRCNANELSVAILPSNWNLHRFNSVEFFSIYYFEW